MAYRFYCPQLPDAGTVTLDESESHHLLHVLRQQVGDVVELFDGGGRAAVCRVVRARKRDVDLEIDRTWISPPPPKRVSIATAVPKGDRFEWLVEKATELGVSSLTPLLTEHSSVDPRDRKLEKLRLTVIAACKQSGRNTLMPIAPVTRWHDFLQSTAHESLLVAHPGGSELSSISLSAAADDGRSWTIVIGPEGGLSDAEVETARIRGAQVVRFGTPILRIETAAIALAARLLL